MSTKDGLEITLEVSFQCQLGGGEAVGTVGSFQYQLGWVGSCGNCRRFVCWLF